MQVHSVNSPHSSQSKAESSELGSPKTTDDIVLERPEEARTRRRHKTESVKQHLSQDRATVTAELEQAQRQAQPAGQAARLLFPSICCTLLHSLTSCQLCMCLNPVDYIPFPYSFSFMQPVREAAQTTSALVAGVLLGALLVVSAGDPFPVQHLARLWLLTQRHKAQGLYSPKGGSPDSAPHLGGDLPFRTSAAVD